MKLYEKVVQSASYTESNNQRDIDFAEANGDDIKEAVAVANHYERVVAVIRAEVARMPGNGGQPRADTPPLQPQNKGAPKMPEELRKRTEKMRLLYQMAVTMQRVTKERIAEKGTTPKLEEALAAADEAVKQMEPIMAIIVILESL